jgi:hypothetical protein
VHFVTGKRPQDGSVRAAYAHLHLGTTVNERSRPTYDREARRVVRLGRVALDAVIDYIGRETDPADRVEGL